MLDLGINLDHVLNDFGSPKVPQMDPQIAPKSDLVASRTTSLGAQGGLWPGSASLSHVFYFHDNFVDAASVGSTELQLHYAARRLASSIYIDGVTLLVVIIRCCFFELLWNPECSKKHQGVLYDVSGGARQASCRLPPRGLQDAAAVFGGLQDGGGIL